MRNLAGFVGGLLITMLMFGYSVLSHDTSAPSSGCREYSPTGHRNSSGISDVNNVRAGCSGAPLQVAVSAQPAKTTARAPTMTLKADARSMNPPTLTESRAAFVTQVSASTPERLRMPEPPASFERIEYRNNKGDLLPAFVTANPNDSARRAAMIWISGREPNSLGEFWREGPVSNEQSGAAFRAAGIVTMYPVLRGGNTAPGVKEYLLGEVDDILSAAEALAKLDYVDPTRIYLGGHGMGATLVLLTAETSNRFAGVFSFGPVSEVTRYPSTVIPINFEGYRSDEAKLRSPIHWLHGIVTPTYVIEGSNLPGNRADVEKLCAAGKSAQLHCLLIDDADHFSVLSRVTTVIASRVAMSDVRPVTLHANEFKQFFAGR